MCAAPDNNIYYLYYDNEDVDFTPRDHVWGSISNTGLVSDSLHDVVKNGWKIIAFGYDGRKMFAFEDNDDGHDIFIDSLMRSDYIEKYTIRFCTQRSGVTCFSNTISDVS